MITGTHTVIRTAEKDDAPRLLEAYRGAVLRATLLDQRREPVQPTRDELGEMLAAKEASRGLFYAVEDPEGRVLGFCGLRGVNQEAQFAEAMLLFTDTAAEAGPAGDETAAFLLDQARGRLHLAKMMTTALDSETGLAELLARNGFVCEGAQRQAVYSGGRWHDLQTWTRFLDGSGGEND